MYIIVVGAGLIGSNFVRIATKDRNEVVVIEKNKEVAEEVASNYDCLVINADASSREALEDAGIDKADTLVCTTESDSVNLVVTMFAKEYDVNSLVSIVHNKKNNSLFKNIGVHIIDNPERLIASHLYRKVKRPMTKEFIEFQEGAEILEIEIGEECKIKNMKIEDIVKKYPVLEKANFVFIIRENDILIPKGNVKIKEKDRVALAVKTETIEEIYNLLV